MGKVVFVVGLPGCGKSCHLKKLEANGFERFDDFKAEAINDSPQFKHSRHYARLLAALRAGKQCAVADIDFCRTAARTEAQLILKKEVAGLQIEWVFFEKDPDQCRANVRARHRASVETDLAKIDEFLPLYCIPEEHRVLSVCRPHGKTDD